MQITIFTKKNEGNFAWLFRQGKQQKKGCYSMGKSLF